MNNRNLIGIITVLLLCVVGAFVYVALKPQQLPPSLQSLLSGTTVIDDSGMIQGLPIPGQATMDAKETETDNTLKPSLVVTDYKSEGPATITVRYTNLPKETSILTICMTNGGCSEGVESFTPSSQTGIYTMSVKNAFGLESQKGLVEGGGQRVVAIDSKGNKIVESEIFLP